jgi:hypothetical protein
MTTAKTSSQVDTSQIIEHALDAFWQVVADHFPAAESGDLSPWQTIKLECAAHDALRHWIENNVPAGAFIAPAVPALNSPSQVRIRQAIETVLDHYYPDEAVHYESTDRNDPNHIYHSLHAIRRWIESGYRED